MELTNQELDRLVGYYTTQPTRSGFIAYLGGHQFRSKNGKMVFPSKKNLMLSLRANLIYTIEAIIGRRLEASGISSYDKYRHPDYVNAYDNFLKQATETGFLQIVELK